MLDRINKIEIKLENVTVNALEFVPENVNPHIVGVFSHGYTSHKGSLLTWGIRLAEYNVASVIFDLPGHYLGSFNEIDSFEHFKNICPKLFETAHKNLIQKLSIDPSLTLIGGHSLGSLFSLQALGVDYFSNLKTLSFLVGLGHGPTEGKHLFETEFYKKTLKSRGELVSPSINPDVVFSWIREEKHHLNIKDKQMVFITGEDDAVVAKDGSERMALELQNLGNTVEIIKPTRLSHHQPELAAAHIASYLKKNHII